MKCYICEKQLDDELKYCPKELLIEVLNDVKEAEEKLQNHIGRLMAPKRPRGGIS